jgi:hypothetical protein
MATTAAGTPYVEASDLVAGYPAVSLALANHIDGLDGGKVLQVVSTTKTDTFSATVGVGANTAITGLTASITPSATSSKILVTYGVGGGLNAVSGNNGILTVLKRDSTAVSIGDEAGSRRRMTAGPGGAIGNPAVNSSSSATFLDSPSTTSAITYSIDIGHTSGASQTVYVNRTDTDTNSSGYSRITSSITLMEISA